MRTEFTNARLILPPGRGVSRGTLIVEDGVIAGCFPENTLREDTTSESDEVIDCGGDFLAPGFIDLHCHGAAGRDAMEASPEAFAEILRYHGARGTTLAVLSTVAASREEMTAVLTAAENEMAHVRIDQTQQPSARQARFGGIHLEGPYFSPKRRGAHRAEQIRAPSTEETRILLGHSDVIARMTLAPELPGSLELVRELTGAGVTVSAGHSDATEEEARAGFASGITQVTHLYNCMSSLVREEGVRRTGLAESALTTPGVLCEVIADGHHLSAILLRLAWLAKGWEEVAIVSDATAGAGLPEGSSFDLGGLSCEVRGGAAWTASSGGKCLAGSTAAMIDGVKMMVEQVGVPLEEAVGMASLVPARSLGLDGHRGSLQREKAADLVRFSEEWDVRGVWISGRKITATG